MKLPKDYLICRICRKPLQLGPGTVTDADGRSVHEACQVERIIGSQLFKKPAEKAAA